MDKYISRLYLDFMEMFCLVNTSVSVAVNIESETVKFFYSQGSALTSTVVLVGNHNYTKALLNMKTLCT